MEPGENQTAERPESSQVSRPIPTKMLPIAAVCVFTLLISGCFGRTRYPSYYALSVAPVLRSDTGPTRQQGTVAVRRFETPAYLRQGRIVYRQAPDQIAFYEYHRWAVEPGTTVTTAVLESLRSCHVFSFVEPYDGQSRADYLLTGRLQRLDEIDYEGGVKVEAKLSAELTNVRTGAVVWTGDVGGTSKVDGRDVSSVVVEMNRALHESIGRLLTSMEQQLTGTELSSR
jgi:ABC-type uncharacterized transport system auxiliary subunit